MPLHEVKFDLSVFAEDGAADACGLKSLVSIFEYRNVLDLNRAKKKKIHILVKRDGARDQRVACDPAT